MILSQTDLVLVSDRFKLIRGFEAVGLAVSIPNTLEELITQ